MQVKTIGYAGALVTVYRLDAGERIPRHRHAVNHSTSVLEGKTVARIFDDRPDTLMEPHSPLLDLPAGIDHEIEAVHDGTIVVNVIKEGSGAAETIGGMTGGVMLVDGTVVHP